MSCGALEALYRDELTRPHSAVSLGRLRFAAQLQARESSTSSEWTQGGSFGAMGDVSVTLLGGFGAAVDGEPVAAGAWRLKKARELVKLLALAPGHRLHREQALDVLWRDFSPDAALNNLHQAALSPGRLAASVRRSRRSSCCATDLAARGVQKLGRLLESPICSGIVFVHPTRFSRLGRSVFILKAP